MYPLIHFGINRGSVIHISADRIGETDLKHRMIADGLYKSAARKRMKQQRCSGINHLNRNRDGIVTQIGIYHCGCDIGVANQPDTPV